MARAGQGVGHWVVCGRDECTHLRHENGTIVRRQDAVMDYPYGQSSGRDQDLVDRGHPGWQRVRWSPLAESGPKRW